MFWQNLQARGLIHDATPYVENLSSPTFYAGIDPTAPSLHIGHLTPLMLMYHLAQQEWKPILVVGGATARIGDPSGKSHERPLLPIQTIEQNTHALSEQLKKILPFPFQLLDNYSWYKDMPVLDFLRHVGKHITVSYLLSKEAIQKRAAEGISFTEFSYPLLQAYDFLYLYQNLSCQVQIGGSDQWGNITTGIELIQKVLGKSAHGITTPLLLRSDGQKFGKTEKGVVWLDGQQTSPYAFYQFWINQTDQDMPKLLGIFSYEPWDKIQNLIHQHSKHPHLRLAQKALAYEMTQRIHGEKTAQALAMLSEVIFDHANWEKLQQMDRETFRQLLSYMPHVHIPASDTPLIEALAHSSLFHSKTEIRQVFQQGGILISQKKPDTLHQPLKQFPPLWDRFWLIQKGKKHFAWLEVS
ncbi:MAG: tyrosine--tRNA ligase [Bacteroidia bacterium]